MLVEIDKIRINSVKFGEVEINKKIYYSDMVVWWDGKVEFVSKRHIINASAVSRLLKRKPYAIIIGTGHKGGAIRVTEGAVETAKKNRVKLFIDSSPDAMDIFNGLVADNKKAVAVMHATC
jgi:hypothetical protein